jgi:hypothetical protein
MKAPKHHAPDLEAAEIWLDLSVELRKELLYIHAEGEAPACRYRARARGRLRRHPAGALVHDSRPPAVMWTLSDLGERVAAFAEHQTVRFDDPRSAQKRSET